MYQQLAQLIKDAVWLKSYLAAVMRLEQEAFTAAYVALGNTKASPAMHAHIEPMHIPTTPVEGGTIPAARPLDSPGQVLHKRSKNQLTPRNVPGCNFHALGEYIASLPICVQ